MLVAQSKDSIAITVDENKKEKNQKQFSIHLRAEVAGVVPSLVSLPVKTKFIFFQNFTRKRTTKIHKNESKKIANKNLPICLYRYVV